jgi:hypothetical protein
LSSCEIVSVLLEATRVVGTVNPDGFLEDAKFLLHLSQGTLAEKLVLTIRARCGSPSS